MVTGFDKDSKKTKKSKYNTVDRETIWRLATIQCSYAEISQVTGLGVPGLKKRFSTLIQSGYDAGKKGIRRAMMDRALKGSDRMLIWLSKQYLGHEDSPTKEGSDIPLPWEDNDIKKEDE